jgi:hypothetical protein
MAIIVSEQKAAFKLVAGIRSLRAAGRVLEGGRGLCR